MPFVVPCSRAGGLAGWHGQVYSLARAVFVMSVRHGQASTPAHATPTLLANTLSGNEAARLVFGAGRRFFAHFKQTRRSPPGVTGGPRRRDAGAITHRRDNIEA